ncbi:MAG: hypothetical protein ISS66_03465 [Desulfobacteraceae bacterium]|nr:hypothetical protein [Desulfobacteraceae bacterium]
MKVNLGSNVIDNCDAALVVNGVEVFRFRERGSDGRLVCDFDLRDKNGNRIAKIAKDRVAHVAEGYHMHDFPKECYVDDSDGNILARVLETGHDELTITGDFWIEGHHVVVTETSLVSGGATMSGNMVSGFGKAISINPGSFAIGTV